MTNVPDRPTASALWPLGIPDAEFHQRTPLKGLITKAEVRVIALSKMRLREDSVAWDIGAGSGSVSIEAALLARRGAVYAIEKNAEDAENVRRNIQKFGVANVHLTVGTAPDGLDAWPDPDAVFVGGTAGRMEAIVRVACRRLRPGGRIVVDCATVENLAEAMSSLKALDMEIDATLVNIARSKDIIGLTRFEALNPVFIVTAWRKVEP